MNHKPPFFGHVRRGYHHGRLKDALIEAALSLVAERGPSGFTLAEAAKLVGVTGAAPYRHFADRNDLMGELARRGFELFGERLLGAWDDGRPDPRHALHRMGRAYLAFARADPGLYTAMFGNPRSPGNTLSEVAAAKAFGGLTRAAGAVLGKMAGKTGVIPAEARHLAYEIWALAHGVAMLQLSGHLDETCGEDPAVILDRGAEALIEAALRRLAKV